MNGRLSASSKRLKVRVETPKAIHVATIATFCGIRTSDRGSSGGLMELLCDAGRRECAAASVHIMGEHPTVRSVLDAAPVKRLLTITSTGSVTVGVVTSSTKGGDAAFFGERRRFGAGGDAFGGVFPSRAAPRPPSATLPSLRA